MPAGALENDGAEALEHDEAGAADLGGAFEVENVELAADLDVIHDVEVEGRLLTPNPELDVIVFAEAVRRARMRKVRKVEQD